MTVEKTVGKNAQKPKKDKREQRLAAQLRANLKRRKGGAKGRDAAAAAGENYKIPDEA